MARFEVTFTFDGTPEEVNYIIDRICENYEPVSMTLPIEVEGEEETDAEQ